MKKVIWILLFFCCFYSGMSHAADLPNIQAFTLTPGANGSQVYSLNLKILVLMTLLMLLPTLLMTMTSFTRIIIVLSILRQAMGMPSVPTNQILVGLGLFLSIFVMAPVLQRANETAVQPYIHGKIDEATALEKVMVPFRQFMTHQVRQDDVALFMRLSGQGNVKKIDDIPLIVLMPAFLTSELKTAFQIGFVLFLPFLIIDLVVASVLMSMGMMMLAPPIVSMPFKIMLFVMVNGWVLIVDTLATSFGHF